MAAFVVVLQCNGSRGALPFLKPTLSSELHRDFPRNYVTVYDSEMFILSTTDAQI